MSNPFTLTFGTVPEQFISRPLQTNKIVSDFLADKPGSNTYMITGVRGSGKTVMLTEIAKTLDERDDWVTVELNPEDDLMDALASKLYNIKDIKPASIEKAGPGMTSEVMVQMMLNVLAKHHKRLLVTIDEASNSEYIKKFAHSYQIFIRDEYPIYMIMTGLYENIYDLQNEKTLTFLYRVPRITLEPLNIPMIAGAYASIFDISTEESARMAALTKGYPFAFQVLGYIRWTHRGQELDRMIPEYDHYLADYIYDKIRHELSETDKKVVLVMSDNEDYMKIQTLREALDMSSSLFSTYRDKLIRKGLVDVSKYGRIGLILPRFREFAIARNEFDSL